MSMSKISKTIRDYKSYLDGIEKLAKPLDEEQKEQLNTILSSQLTLLVCLKQASHLGSVSLNFNHQ